VNDATAYDYSRDAQSGNDTTDADPKIFPDLLQRSLSSQLASFGKRHYLNGS